GEYVVRIVLRLKMMGFGPASPWSRRERRGRRRNLAAFLAAILLATTLFLPSPGARAETADQDYRLGSQDKIRIRVAEWSPSKGEVVDWPALTGEFTIGAGGRLDLPILGSTQAAGLSTSELAHSLASLLQAKTGLKEMPSASVDIIQFRPFYV